MGGATHVGAKAAPPGNLERIAGFALYLLAVEDGSGFPPTFGAW
jgi:hypothetical protein